MTYTPPYYIIPALYKPLTEKQFAEKIIIEVSLITEIKVSLIKSKSRNEDVCSARFICSTLIKEYTKLSLSKIGLVLNRDHSTIIHHLQETEYRLDNANNWKDFCKLYRSANLEIKRLKDITKIG